MKSHRRLWVYFVQILYLGISISTPAPVFEDETRPNFVCTNDMEETMSCHFQKNSGQQNCSEYTLNITNEENDCIFKQCDSGCCCSINMVLIISDTCIATVSKENKIVASKSISITYSIKPKAPTTVSVNETHGNFKVTWKRNAAKAFFRDRLIDTVTYHKKGDMEKVYNKTATQAVMNGFSYYEIPGQELEPGTYLVRVKSYTNYSGRYSDSSEEVEFEVPASSYVLDLAEIIILSVASVVITSVAIVCFVNLKAVWWDKYPNPKLINVHPAKIMLLAPSQENFSNISVDVTHLDDDKLWSKCAVTDRSCGSQEQSSGVSTGSSSLSYAKVEPNIKAGVQKALSQAMSELRITPSVTTSSPTDYYHNCLSSTSDNLCGVTADDLNSFTPSAFSNKTYSIMPAFQTQITSLLSSNQTDTGILCGSAYQPTEGNMSANDQEVLTCLIPVQQDAKLQPNISSLIQTDMSYQQCSVDSGILSHVEDSILFSAVSNINTNESSDGVVSDVPTPNDNTQDVCSKHKIKCDQFPLHDSRPADGCSFLVVDDDYQSFQNLVAQPKSLCALQNNCDKRADLDTFPGKNSSSSRVDIPNFIPGPKDGQCLLGLHCPFINFSGDLSMPIIMDSGYQSVQH
ncbi:uncharacterized protein LOC117526177 isoform X2 [Thalassophryne amazonica]|uniref:uncharacterized protein LOC117526177 isoform X2 n=2 Tax=Thalassophryne amazonica TaxID=390379 RepID=UPI001471B9E1|nr:uncharacterized protein LOC117526177 isoform X2 [Thalassophryne amazonica]